VQRARGQRHEVFENLVAVSVTGGASKELQEVCLALLWCERQSIKDWWITEMTTPR